MKKYLLIAALCLMLTGCSVPSEPAPSPTLPPVIDDMAAPVGDAALTYTADAALYLPSRDGGLGRVPPEQLSGWLEGGG